MPSKSEIKEAAKAAFSSLGIQTHTTRTITAPGDMYATVVIANIEGRNKYISNDTLKEYDADLQIVIYMLTNEGDSVLDDLVDEIQTSIEADSDLNVLLDDLQFKETDEVDEAQGYDALALIFEITYQQ
jgi:hypothetical protein